MYTDLYDALRDDEKAMALNFAGDPILKNIVLSRYAQLKKEIEDMPPQKSDPIDYTRQMQDLFARKEEAESLMNMLQSARNFNKPQQNED